MNLPLTDGTTIISEREGYCGINKPAGLRVHPNQEGMDPLAMMQAPYDFKREGYVLKDGMFFLLHRIDAPTSGVVVGTQLEKEAEQARQWFRDHQVTKLYLAWVFGYPRKQEGMWNLSLQRTRSEGKVRMSARGPLEAQTAYRVLDSRQEFGLTRTLLQLEPVTGRTHQLRIHCAEHGLPIVGDRTYGDPKKNRFFAEKSHCDRLFLHAWYVKLPNGVSFEAPPPELFF